MKRPSQQARGSSPPHWRIALTLSTLLLLYEALVFRLDVLDFASFYAERLIFGRKYLLSGFVAGTTMLGLLVTAAALVMTATARGARRIVYGAAIVVCIVLDYGYLAALGHHMTVHDVAIAGSLDLRGVLDGVQTYLRPVELLLPLTALLLALRFWPRSDDARSTVRAELGATAIFLSGAIALPWLLDYFPTPSVTAFVRVAATASADRLARYDGPRRPVEWEAGTPPRRNVVLIVDESVRADHLSVNGYRRSTTPTLERLHEQGLLASWGTVAATTTNSIDSNRALWTGYFGSPDRNEYRRRTSIMQIARAAGYETWLVDGWMDNFWIGPAADLEDIDHHLTPARAFRGVDSTQIDRAIARWLAETLRSSSGMFIWINKRGVHWPYHEQYPPESRRWTPEHRSRRIDADAVALANSYDNAIAHNVEGFFAELEPDLAEILVHTTMLYTADHGQTLSEQGELRTHGGESVTEAMVPGIVLSAAPQPAPPEALATHAHLYLLLLDLLGLPEHARAVDAETLKAPVSAAGRRYYFWHQGMRDGLGRYERLPFGSSR